jgi:hypothetical protein
MIPFQDKIADVIHRYVTQKRLERATQVAQNSAAGCAAWSATLLLGQPLGFVTRVSSSTPLAGSLLGLGTIAAAAVVCGETSRTLTSARWGRRHFGPHGQVPPQSELLPFVMMDSTPCSSQLLVS